MSVTNILYNKIGSGYNTTRLADPFISQKLFEFLEPNPAGLYLDIGCGTGNYTIALNNMGLKIYGVDPSEKMLAIASAQNQNINWVLGSAENMPVEDNQFNGVVATLTIHHWHNLTKAFSEIQRVLKPKGKIVIYTSTPEQMKGYWLNYYFPNMLADSIMQMPPLKLIESALNLSGFKIAKTDNYFIDDDLQDAFLYVGKNKPELYFSEDIRKGISSFSALAHAAEVEQGLIDLAEDVKSDLFKSIRLSFNDKAGDYLFVIAEKK